MSNQQRRVVVTGMGALTPIGHTVQGFWEAMLRGESGAAPITYFDTEPFETKFACELKNFDPLDYIDRKLARRLDPFCQFALAVTRETVADGKLEDLSEEERNEVGVIFGSGIGGMQLFHEQTTTYNEHGPRRISPFFIPMLISDMAPGLISMEYGLRGPNYCVVSACATGNNNIGDAFMLIQQGRTDMMLSGSAEASVSVLGIGGFNAMKALSTRNDEPARASRPFDATRDGFVLGEGAGGLVLEELEHAKKRGAKIYAEIIGIGMSNDAYHMAAPHPEGLGARLAMERVLKDAKLQPEEVDYLNMHGTSTPPGDVAETKAIKMVFGDHAYEMNLSSTKSMTGHLLGAAGAIEAIATILAVQNDIIPPTINFEHPDPECDLNYTF
ncbi:MAG TPA: beta-ketoacyl-ACP synthase II, partial [Rhodothermales bacterium]|nr:beta-ketoacyl-ACP synthase II [Rhodothermales bacterium]